MINRPNLPVEIPSGIPAGINNSAMRDSLGALFRLTVLVIVCTMIPNLGDSLVGRCVTALRSITSVVAGFVIAYTVFRMGIQMLSYRTAGIFMLLSRFLTYFVNIMVPFLISAVFPIEMAINAMVYTLVSLGISFVTAVLYYIGVYKLYQSHREVLGGLDLDLARKWKVLFFIEVVLAIIYSLASPALSGLFMTSKILHFLVVWATPVVFHVPVYVLNCCYLRRMMKYFEE